MSLSDPSQKRIYEVLLRLRTRSGDIVPPGAFLPAAERYNLSNAIDRWVVDHTFAWMELHFQQLDDVDHLARNLSGASTNGVIGLRPRAVSESVLAAFS